MPWLLTCEFPADLYLAVALTGSNTAALQHFERSLLPDMVAAVAHLLTPTLKADDVRQILRARLFVPPPDETPKIAQYTGQGPLAGWLRVIAVRAVLNLRRDHRRSDAEQTAASEEDLLDLASPTDNPELAFLRARFKDDFKQAFHDALMELETEDRNLLRLHLVEGLTIDEIAPVFGVHRATAARRLQKARERILEGTRRLLTEHLRLTESECSSLIGLVVSQLDVSIIRVLSTTHE